LPTACAQGYASSRTCEIGLSEQAGFAYRSFLKLVDRCARPASPTPIAQGPRDT
jgi:D-lactate dehydrogenase